MRSPPTLHFFCGKAGAGKSTLASRLAQEHRAVLLSEDIWLTRLFGDQMKVFDDYVRFSRRLEMVIGPLCIDLLTLGQSVVLDFQANTRARRAWVRSLFESMDAAHVLHFVNTPNEVCLERIEKRNRERPEGSHHVTEETFYFVTSYFQEPDETEGFITRLHGPEIE